MIPVLANEDFRHLLDDVAEWLHLGALAGDTDDRHRCVLEHDRHVDAVLRTLELVLAVDGHGLLRLDGEARALVRGANTRGIGARDDGARGIEQVDLVVDDVFEVVDDGLGDLRSRFMSASAILCSDTSVSRFPVGEYGMCTKRVLNLRVRG